jgi:hypothetical protein
VISTARLRGRTWLPVAQLALFPFVRAVIAERRIAPPAIVEVAVEDDGDPPPPEIRTAYARAAWRRCRDSWQRWRLESNGGEP